MSIELQVTHIFSHINQTYVISGVTVPDGENLEINSSRPTKWVTKEQFVDSAVSTAMKKARITHLHCNNLLDAFFSVSYKYMKLTDITINLQLHILQFSGF